MIAKANCFMLRQTIFLNKKMSQIQLQYKQT